MSLGACVVTSLDGTIPPPGTITTLAIYLYGTQTLATNYLYRVCVHVCVNPRGDIKIKISADITSYLADICMGFMTDNNKNKIVTMLVVISTSVLGFASNRE